METAVQMQDAAWEAFDKAFPTEEVGTKGGGTGTGGERSRGLSIDETYDDPYKYSVFHKRSDSTASSTISGLTYPTVFATEVDEDGGPSPPSPRPSRTGFDLLKSLGMDLGLGGRGRATSVAGSGGRNPASPSPSASPEAAAPPGGDGGEGGLPERGGSKLELWLGSGSGSIAAASPPRAPPPKHLAWQCGEDGEPDLVLDGGEGRGGAGTGGEERGSALRMAWGAVFRRFADCGVSVPGDADSLASHARRSPPSPPPSI